MTKNECSIPIELLSELLLLDAETGTLTWKDRLPRHFQKSRSRSAAHTAANWNSRNAGATALCCVDAYGHLYGRIFNKSIYAHRAVFALTSGAWPEHEVDHINGVPGDNRPANLRDVNHQENLRNMKLSKANTSGATGVTFNRRRQKWMAHMTVDGVYQHLGYHVDKGAAIAARATASALTGFHTNHGVVR